MSSLSGGTKKKRERGTQSFEKLGLGELQQGAEVGGDDDARHLSARA
jgi:hypothetical protein